MVELLLKLWCKPKSPVDAVEDTPLMQAARSANLKLVKLLLDAGAEVNAEDKSGQTALDAVEMYTHSSEEHRTVAAFSRNVVRVSGKKKNWTRRMSDSASACSVDKCPRVDSIKDISLIKILAKNDDVGVCQSVSTHFCR